MASSTIETFDDPDAYYAALHHTHTEGKVVGRGTFRAESTRIRFDRLWLHRSEENLPRIAHAEIDPNVFAIAFAIRPGQQAYVSGVELLPGHVIALGAGLIGYNRSTTPSRWGTISLAHETIAAAGQALMGRELTAPQVTMRIKPPAALLSRLLNLHEAAGHLARTAPDILANPQVGRAIEQALVEAMVSCLAGDDPIGVRNVHRHHAAVMRRFEAVLEANPEGPLHIAELCKAVGASYPTLRACCQEHLGMSPKRYLWLRRMHLARRALRRADPHRTTVTDIATSCGFWEFGRFAVAYRSLFEESPSTTLRRAPEDPKPGEIDGSPWKFIKSA